MASFEQRGKLWTVRYRDNAGANRRESGFRTKGEAKAWWSQREADQRDGILYDRTLTFSRLVKLYLDQHHASPSRIARLRLMLRHAEDSFGDVPVEDLTPQRIGAWAATLPTDSIRHMSLSATKQVLRQAVLWRALARNPADGIKNPAPEAEDFIPFTDWAEVERLDRELPAHYRGLAIFMVGTGLRPEEWPRLRWEHVDMKGRALNLPKSVTKAKTPARRVPLRGRVMEVLASRDGATGFVWTSERGGPIDIRNFRKRVWYAAQERINDERAEALLDPLPIRRPYDARHTYATWGLRAGFNTFALAKRMGTSVKMIDDTYGHFTLDSEAHELGLMDAFDRAGQMDYEMEMA